MVFSPDVRTLAWCGSQDGIVSLGEVAIGEERAQFTGHRSSACALAFASNGKFLISAGDYTTALVWDLTGRSSVAPAGFFPLSEPKLAACWEDLASPQATRAYLAVQRLMRNPALSAAFLGKRLMPVPVVDKKRLARLIADLDSNSFQIRQGATAELEKLGGSAAAALRAALADKISLEVRQRVQKLVDKLAIWTPERLRALRGLEVLEGIGSRASRKVVAALAQGATGAWLTEEARLTHERLLNRPPGNDLLDASSK